MSDYALTLSDGEISRYQHMAASAQRAEADLWTAAGIVEGAAVVDVDVSGVRTRPVPEGLADLTGRYFDFQTARGNDLSVGLRLAELLGAAGLEVLEFRGRFDIIPVGPGFRPPAWAARDLMVEAGAATAADVERWGATLERLDQGDPPNVTTFVPQFSALGRRPA
ncbi:MAG TPA: hypothetical protein VHT97_06545 [Acidimicrobiales bacterium]|nr:hypothetical protein [Acidimicrobiales bacterium]